MQALHRQQHVGAIETRARRFGRRSDEALAICEL